MAYRPRDYGDIKRLAKATAQNIPDMLALSRQNDPFFAGAPATVVQAEWFTALWSRFGYRQGVHLRRVHYQVVSQENATRADGSPYQNTESAWNYLCQAAKAARYLGLVPVEGFVDRRNPDPHTFIEPRRYSDQPGLELSIHSYDFATHRHRARVVAG